MLLFLISCFSFLLLSQYPFLKSHQTHKIKSKIWSLPLFFLHKSNKNRIFTTFSQNSAPKSDFHEDSENGSLLNLPDLVLDTIIEKLSPAELFNMSMVCGGLKQRCTSDYFWSKHLSEKWGAVIGDAAVKDWQSHVASNGRFLNGKKQKRNYFLDFLWWSKTEVKQGMGGNNLVSVMSFYLALESGRFWFPAQVFNRENGSAGFMLSCYDAHLSYESTSDNFVARYTAQGRRMIEGDIEWSRIRAPSVVTPAEILHISDCLNHLKPDDHIEIQWRKNKEFPYGWWYGVVGHLESCVGNKLHCHCHKSDSVILEFKQYSSGSRWRKALINRKDHREIGNEIDGFYGGIRKLYREDEISKWKHLWPNCTLD